MSETFSSQYKNQSEPKVCDHCGKNFNLLSENTFLEGKWLHLNCVRLIREKLPGTKPDGECQLCSKPFTWYGGKDKFEGYYLHPNCLPEWRKKQAIAEILTKPEAKILLRMPSVILNERASSRQEKPIGNLYFTSRGLFFFQRGIAPAGTQVPNLLLGMVGQIIANTDHANKVEKARQAIQSEEEAATAEELAKQLEAAKDVRMFRSDSVVDITDSYEGLKLKTRNTSVGFELVKKKETFQIFEDRIKQYLANSNLPNLDKNGSLKKYIDHKDEIVADLKSQDGDVRAEAMTKLAILKDLTTVAILLTGLRDPDRMVRLRASEALAWVTGQDFGEDEKKWVKWWSHNKPT
jgi:hypothetical protein